MRKFFLASIGFLAVSSAAFAQGTGTSGGGGGGLGGGSAGSSSGGFSGAFGQNNQTGQGGSPTGTPGSTQSFSGNLDAPTAFGQTTGTTGGAGGTKSGVPTAINPFQAFYSNPQALGMQLVTVNTSATGTTTSQIAAFGQPIFATTTTGTGTGTGFGGAATGGRTAQGGLSGNTGNFGTATYGAGGVNTGSLGGGTFGGVGGVGGAAGGFGGTSGFGGGGLGTATGASVSYGIPTTFSTIGTTRAAQYITSLGFTPAKAPAGKLQGDLQGVVVRSGLLSSRGVQLAMDGGTVVLRGQVADERERRLAEGIVRLSPGVRDVRNELSLQTQP